MQSARILIVEDEFLVAMDLEAVLKESGHDCTGIAPDLETALQLADTKPDLALVDINLRDGPTGPQIAEHLTRDYGVVVLFVTANPRMAPARLPGALGVLSKPCDENVMRAAIAYALDRRDGAPLMAPPAGLMLFDQD